MKCINQSKAVQKGYTAIQKKKNKESKNTIQILTQHCTNTDTMHLNPPKESCQNPDQAKTRASDNFSLIFLKLSSASFLVHTNSLHIVHYVIRVIMVLNFFTLHGISQPHTAICSCSSTLIPTAKTTYSKQSGRPSQSCTSSSHHNLFLFVAH